MDNKRIDELLNTLGFIAWYKSMLPFSVRGWVNSLGLHVHERKAGRWTRLQAGGSLRSYFDAWKEDEGHWQVKTFDQKTWEHRFAAVLRATYNIADYLLTYAAHIGELGPDQRVILEGAIEHYKSTGLWRWLPGVPPDCDMVSRQMVGLKPRDLHEEIAHAEGIRRASRYPFDWEFLALLYDLAGRYKDEEKALKAAYELVCADYKGAEWGLWRWRRTIGMLYFAAFSNSKRIKDVVVLGNFPSKATPESLGYTVEEVRTLAAVTLQAALEDEKHFKMESYATLVQEIESAIATCRTP
ncbi:MAG: hypothetical protein HW397_324 [Dehalococcoidia bacterium]|nr:hypothetical protein [Dehalococcoidia bacterium]